MLDQTLPFVDHPSDHVLQAFAAGKISEHESRQVEQHLESCAQCGARFDAISLQDDPLVERLRKSPNHSLSDTASLKSDAEQSTGIFEVASTAKVRAGAAAASETSIGSYEILAKIAQGGMGVVYKARHKTLGRVVALKRILAGQLAGGEEVERFYEEARAAATLRHPNIIAIHEIGEIDGQPFFTMDFIEGESLAAKFRDQPLAGREAAELLAPVAAAVHYAHQHGVIHRDLKPANVLIDAQNRPYVTDFGLAKRQEGERDLTMTGQILGTPSYMPPEQALGDGSQVGPVSDVYALGAILYAMLTGRPPFTAASVADVLCQVLTKEPVPPRQLTPTIDVELETICLKCLEKEPARRYATAQELVDELQRYLRHEPILARPIGAMEKSWRWCRRNALVANLGLGIFLSLLVGAIGSTYLAWQSSEHAAQSTYNAQVAQQNERLAGKNAAEATAQRNEAKTQEQLAKTNLQKSRDSEQKAKESEQQAKAALVDAKRQKKIADDNWLAAETRSYAQNLKLAQIAWKDDNLIFARKHLNDCQPLLRGWEYDYLLTQFRRGQRSFTGHAFTVTCVAFHPKERLIVTGSRDRTVKLWDLTTGQCLRTLIGHQQGITSVGFSSDGKLIVSGSTAFENPKQDGEVIVWNAAGEILHRWNVLGGTHSVSFQPQGRSLLVLHGKMVSVWDIVNETHERKLELIDSPALAAEWSPDGRAIAASLENKHLKIWDAQSGAEKLTIFGRDNVVSDSIAWSPDGKRLAAKTPKAIQSWDTETGKETTRFEDNQIGPKGNIAYSPCGRWFAVVQRPYSFSFTQGTMGFSITYADKNTGEVLDSSNPGGQQNHKSNVTIWNAKTGSFVASPLWHSEEILGLEFSQDGEQIATASADRTAAVHRWNRDVETTVEQIPTVDMTVNLAKLSPNGELIAYYASTVAGWSFFVREIRSGRTVIKEGGAERSTTFVFQFSPDSQQLIVGNSIGQLKIWDLASSELINKIEASSGIGAVSVSPDGRFIATLEGQKLIHIRTMNNGEIVQRIEGVEDVQTLTFTSDSKRLIGGYSGLRAWEISSGVQTVVYAQTDRTREKMLQFIRALAISSDGKRLYAGYHDGLIRSWDIYTGKDLGSFVGHSSPVYDLRFTPDQQRLISGSGDGTLRFWQIDQRQEVFSLENRNGAFVSMSISKDGNEIVALNGMARGGAYKVARYERNLIPFRVDGPDLIANAKPDGNSWTKTNDGWRGVASGGVQEEEGRRIFRGTKRFLALPSEVRGSYRLQVDFTRVEGAGDVNVLFPVGDRLVMLMTKEDQVTLEQIDGGAANVQARASLKATQRYILSIEVRENGPHVQISFALDGLVIGTFNGRTDRLSLRDFWKVGEDRRIQLALFGSTAIFHQVKFAPLDTGELNK